MPSRTEIIGSQGGRRARPRGQEAVGSDGLPVPPTVRRQRASLGSVPRWPVALAGLVVTVLVWELLAKVFFTPVILPAPTDVWSSFLEFVRSGSASVDVEYSGMELGIGYAAGVSCGLVLGFVLGTWPLIDAAVSAQLTFFYSVPIVALAPLMVVWFGIGLMSKIVVVALLSLFPVIVNTRTGVLTADRDLVTVAQSFGASRAQILRHIVLPWAVPSVLAGMRLGIAYGIVGVFIAELVASQHGVGQMVLAASSALQTSLVFVGLLIFGGTGVVLTAILLRVERHLGRWRSQK